MNLLSSSFKIKSIFFKSFLTIFLILLLNVNSIGQNFPKRPNSLVNDYIGILSPTEKQALEQKLVAFNDSTSNQITIIIVDDLLGFDPADYAQRIGEEWGVGQKEFENGIVILVKPTGGEGQRETFIAQGYGLEGIIPDLTAKRIVDNELLPNFRKEEYYKGLDEATDVLMSLAIKEYSSDEYNKKASGSPLGFIIPLILFAIIFMSTRMSAAKSYSKVNSIPYWTAFWLMASSSRRHTGGSWGNFTSGSGGFGGFGGGGFGGGGAGGSW